MIQYAFCVLFAVSVVVFAFIAILMMSEFIYYRGTELKYTYEVDKDADRYN